MSRAVQEIATTSHALSRTVEAIAGQAKEIAAANREQELGLTALGGTGDEVRRIAGAIAASTRAQLAAMRRVQSQADAVGGLVDRSREAVRTGNGNADLLATTIATLQQIDSRERAGFAHTTAEAGRLVAQAADLRQEITRLTAGGREARPPAPGDGAPSTGG
jgi:hypothetical protein